MEALLFSWLYGDEVSPVLAKRQALINQVTLSDGLMRVASSGSRPALVYISDSLETFLIEV